MPCYKPLHGFVSKTRNPNGKRNTVFNLQQAAFEQTKEGYGPIRRQMPCGNCIGCRLEKSRQWAMRIMHEASLHDKNCFITTTYDPEHLPPQGHLRKSDFQKFIKRLRKNTGLKIRFYHCGEYGEDFGRPHYHACIFGADFRDGEIVSNRDGNIIYSSPTLEKIWGKGFVAVGELTFESAAYTARYVTKKINGKMKEKHYEEINPQTGEITQRPQEYATMSRRPGIGGHWYDKFSSDAYPKDFITVRGRKMRPPKYYDSQLEKNNKKLFDKIKSKRLQAMASLKNHPDFSDERLSQREKCQTITAQQLKRSYENDS